MSLKMDGWCSFHWQVQPPCKVDILILSQSSATHTDLPEVIERIKQYIQSHPNVLNDPDRWIEGMGWDQTKWESKKFPTAVGHNLPNILKHKTKDVSQEDLNQDPLLKGRPISLARTDGHARWVSPRVLDIMDTLPADDEVTGGQIIRDANGKPTGKLLHNLYARLAQTSLRDFCRQGDGPYSITSMEWSTNGRIFRSHHQHCLEVWANKYSRCGYQIVHDLIFQKVRCNQVFVPGRVLLLTEKQKGVQSLWVKSQVQNFFLFLKTLIAAPLSNGWCCVAKEWLRVGNRKLHQWGMGSWRPSFYQLRKTGAAHVAGREVVCGW